MRIYVTSLGCKLNQSEMDALATQLAGHGYSIVAAPAEADLCVLNTCAVTHVAAQKSRQALRRLHRENPQARLIATGCYAELAPQELENLPGIVSVAGNQEKGTLAEFIAHGPWGNGETGLVDVTAQPPQPAAEIPRSRTRALVKIQDGCDNACTYCIIRVARGPQQSRPAAQVMAEVQALLAAGYQEIVLTGVHIGAYGQDRRMGQDSDDLWALTRRILRETAVPRLRLSSIEPWDLIEDAFRLWDDARLCRHLHLPLQSGCDSTLRRMARHYTVSGFAALVAAARAAIPNLAVTTDLIVGFPGESNAHFAESLDFVRSLGFARVHVFPYSMRAGTPAAGMPNQVPPAVKADRARAMRTVAAAGEQAFRQQFVGRTADVLWESRRWGEDEAIWSGLTDNYLRVYTTSDDNLTNTFARTRLVSLTSTGLQGRIERQQSGE